MDTGALCVQKICLFTVLYPGWLLQCVNFWKYEFLLFALAHVDHKMRTPKLLPHTTSFSSADAVSYKLLHLLSDQVILSQWKRKATGGSEISQPWPTTIFPWSPHWRHKVVHWKSLILVSGCVVICHFMCVSWRILRKACVPGLSNNCWGTVKIIYLDSI